MIHYTIIGLIALVLLYTIFDLIREVRTIKRAKHIQAAKEVEQRFMIESKVKRDLAERAEYWDNFHTNHYVQVLENREEL